MASSLRRVFRLAAPQAVSWRLWLLSAPFLILGLLFTELPGNWSIDVAVRILAVGVGGQLAMGLVFALARWSILRPANRGSAGGREVLSTYVVAGAARGVSIGFLADALLVGERALAIRVPTSIVLVSFSLTLLASSAELWARYRHQRAELLRSLLSGEHSRARQGVVVGTLRDVSLARIADDIGQARRHTLLGLDAIRHTVVNGTITTESVDEIFSRSDAHWRRASHRAWLGASMDIPGITLGELLRTMAGSKPLSLIVLVAGPVYGVARTLESVPLESRLLAFGAWLMGSLMVGALTNALAARAGRAGVAVLLVGFVALQALPVAVGTGLSLAEGLLLQMWFVGFVSAFAAFVLGFPPALERSGQVVLERLHERLDATTLANVRSQSEMYVTAQKVAGYLHAQVRGDFLRLSMALRAAIENGDRERTLGIIEDLRDLVGHIDVSEPEAPPLETLSAFLTNWGRVIEISHQLDRVPVPEGVEPALEAIVMEAVNNAVRHSGATSIDIVCAEEPEGFTLRITSDGAAVASGPSAGLGTTILNQYAPGRWQRRTTPDQLQELRVSFPQEVSRSRA